MAQQMKAAATASLTAPAFKSASTATITTRMRFDASVRQVWEQLVFYEEIGRRPPLHLRFLLPVPVRTEGRVAEVGDEARCIYERGHLIKRITHIEKERVYAFDVAEQALSVGGGMRLSGGRYTLRELPAGDTEVAVETRYTSPRRPRWFWQPLERMVYHWFHRYLLRSMRREIG